MKTTLALLTLGIASYIGCNENVETVSPKASPQGTPFEIPAWNYATNHFFVDTTYRNFYEQYYQDESPVVHPETQIVEEEVWVQANALVGSPWRPGVAYLSLRPRPAQGYDSVMRSPAFGVPGEIELALFVKLNRSQYQMTADGYLGVVSFKYQVSDQQTIGIAYRRADGTQFGEFVHDLPDTSRVLILKMVKPQNLLSNGRAYRVAWDQLLKNIYRVGAYNVREAGFVLDILFGPAGSGSANRIQNQRLLRVLGLDRYNPDGTPAPSGDGLFDFRPGRTIDPVAGEIILPFLRPFDNGIVEYFRSQRLPLPDTSYFMSGVYDTTRTYAALSPHYFKLSGRALTY